MDKNTTITLPLQELLNELLLEQGSRSVSPLVGNLVFGHLQNKHTAYVQFEFHDDPRSEQPLSYVLDRPILWRYDEWMRTSQNWRSQRNYAHSRRVQDWIRDANVQIVKKVAMRELLVDEAAGQAIAYRMVHGNKMQQMKALGVTRFITKEEEL